MSFRRPVLVLASVLLWGLIAEPAFASHVLPPGASPLAQAWHKSSPAIAVHSHPPRLRRRLDGPIVSHPPATFWHPAPGFVQPAPPVIWVPGFWYWNGFVWVWVPPHWRVIGHGFVLRNPCD